MADPRPRPSPEPRDAKRLRRSDSDHTLAEPDQYAAEIPRTVVCQQPPFSEDAVGFVPDRPASGKLPPTTLTSLPLPPSSPLSSSLHESEFQDEDSLDSASTDPEPSSSLSSGSDVAPQLADISILPSNSAHPLGAGGSSTTIVPSNVARDSLLTYAYRLYESPQQPIPIGLTPVPIFNAASHERFPDSVYRSQLRPLLATMLTLHPRHLPTMLLLGCVHHAVGDYDASLAVNRDILAIDPNYVEAMCNMGTTLQALSRVDDAQEWWWKALQRRPTYWVALDNVLNMLLTTPHTSHGASDRDSPTPHSKQQALRICRFVLTHIVGADGRLLISIPAHQLYRLQGVYNTTASLCDATGDSGLSELMDAVVLVIRPPTPYANDQSFSFRDLLLSTFVAGLLLSAQAGRELPGTVVRALGYSSEASLRAHIEIPGYGLMRAVHKADTRLLDALFPSGIPVFPVVLLSPAQTMRLPLVLFSASTGALPAICRSVASAAGALDRWEPVSEFARQQTNQATSAVLLSLARLVQDAPPGAALRVPGFPRGLHAGGSLLLLLYTLALALAPAAAVHNNLGLVLASMAPNVIVDGQDDSARMVDELALAKAYFERGLKLDHHHPHLLTNLGSLLKDRGHVSDAIRLYMTAIQYKPDFEVALGNLGNAFKDIGRPRDAALYYSKALQVRPNFPEAACGLVGSLLAICDWRGRGGVEPDIMIDAEGEIFTPGTAAEGRFAGWITDMLEVCRQQVFVPYTHNIGAVETTKTVDDWLQIAQNATGQRFGPERLQRWRVSLGRFFGQAGHPKEPKEYLNEGGFLIRFNEWLERQIQRRWYIEVYGPVTSCTRRKPAIVPDSSHARPLLPPLVGPPPVPSVLPFHAFTSPLSPRTIRIISHRNALRVAHMSLTGPWRPVHVYPPPPPPFQGKLNIGYVSSDLNNHPLSHLMQSVFGLHDRSLVNVFVYATGASSDDSSYRRKIEAESQHFHDMSTWSLRAIIDRIVKDQIHILVNLGGYTKNARNEIFASRPSPIQISLMGFAGSLAAGWCDYLVCDPIACPQDLGAGEKWREIKTSEGANDHRVIDFDATLDPESASEDWMYTEKFIFMPYTYLVTDHKQSSRGDEGLSLTERTKVSPAKLWHDEESRRYSMRKEIFPDLADDIFIFANFNQLYKISPAVFDVWVRILKRVPKSILWLLNFPESGAEHLRRSAELWGDANVASRIYFTDVATKEEHIYRGRVADLFLDTTECSAHTVAADALWTGTPVLTWPCYLYKMCSRVGASIAHATGFGNEMTVNTAEEYEERAVTLALSVHYTYGNPVEPGVSGKARRGRGTLIELRRNLYLNRDKMPLFDTARWTRNLEKGYREAWRRWAEGTEFEGSDEWERCMGPEKESGCIFIQDEDHFVPETTWDE